MTTENISNNQKQQKKILYVKHFSKEELNNLAQRFWKESFFDVTTSSLWVIFFVLYMNILDSENIFDLNIWFIFKFRATLC